MGIRVKKTRVAVVLCVGATVALVPTGRATAEGVQVSMSMPSRGDAGDVVKLDIALADLRPETGSQTVTASLTFPKALKLSRLTTTSGRCIVPTSTCDVNLDPSGERVHVDATFLVVRQGSYEISIAAWDEEASDLSEASHELSVAGPSCSVVGTLGPDRLSGTDSSDVICGFYGDDTFRSDPDDDFLSGGNGLDTVDFTNARARVEADLTVGRSTGSGSDTMDGVEAAIGSVFDDELRGTNGRDRLEGGPGSDLLVGRRGTDELHGGGGDDDLDGGSGPDALTGGPGIDTCSDANKTRRRGCERRWNIPPFAEGAGVALFSVSPRTLLAGFHESLFDSAAPLDPLGPHVVMSSRGRGTSSTSAADIAVPDGTVVRAPVTGRVVNVRDYRLYCSTIDTQVVIRPRGSPNKRVMIVHVTGPRVEPGDRVISSVSKIGTVRNLPFGSQIERYEDAPHIHIEIHQQVAPIPGCAA